MSSRSNHPDAALTLDELRGRAIDQRYWRSLDELTPAQDVSDVRAVEFAADASQWPDDVSRRNFLKIMGASTALAGLAGCYRKPVERIAPPVSRSEETVPGKPVYFATAMPFNGYGLGVLALSREGRPVKIEGNPDHPASLGATNVFMQASVLDLYDPDRSRMITRGGDASSWGAFLNELRERLATQPDGKGVRLLTGPSTSPTLLAQIEQFQKQFPGALWHVHDPAARVNTAAEAAFGQRQNIQYDFSKARVVLSLGSDFLFEEPLSLRYARQFMDGRRVRRERAEMNRLYVVESTMSLAGSMADHRLALGPDEIETFARALTARLTRLDHQGAESLPPQIEQWISAVADDLSSGPSIVIAGEFQPPVVRALAHAMNRALGNVGQTVYYTDPIRLPPNESLQKLSEDMRSGQVSTLIILDTNPAYTAPVDLDFADLLVEFSSRRDSKGQFTNFSAHLSLHDDETSFRCQWHIPAAHYLESWSDIRAFDGTASIIQPLIAPLFDGKTAHELLEAAMGRPDRSGFEIVREHWASQAHPADFEQWWTQSLQAGVIANTAFSPRAPSVAPLGTTLVSSSAQGRDTSRPYNLIFAPDPSIWTGDYANNGWLQELPKPFTKLTWDNAAIISPATSHKLGNGKLLHDGDMVSITYQNRTLKAPILMLPGMADDTVLLHLGYGRPRTGRVGSDNGSPRGVNAYQLRTTDSPWLARHVMIATTGEHYDLALTRSHHGAQIPPAAPGLKEPLKPQVSVTPTMPQQDVELNSRRIVRLATLEQFHRNPDFAKEPDRGKKVGLSLYPGWDYSKGHQWAMSIDQTACIGCNACVIGCQSENNVPVVGKSEVMRQREMHWIRIDDYFTGALENPTVVHQPVPCMHCENAPCELVCPVGATTHSVEGVNEMTYNRCIGTRYCSNNCPYKVRRFNFFLYSDYSSSVTSLRYNPDVTVRSRGVMEKCTYCIQRLDRTRIEIEKATLVREEAARLAQSTEEKERHLDLARQSRLAILGNLQTACQQACPTQAIVFGDKNEPSSLVHKIKSEPHDYALLAELNTAPRTTYLARITNPNPRMSFGGSGSTPTSVRQGPNPPMQQGGFAT